MDILDDMGVSKLSAKVLLKVNSSFNSALINELDKLHYGHKWLSFPLMLNRHAVDITYSAGKIHPYATERIPMGR